MGESVRNTSNTKGSKQYIMLFKDRKPISRTQSDYLPDEAPSVWSLCDLVQRTKIQFLAGLPHFNLYPAGETSRDRKEWGLFLTYLMSRDTVAVCKSELYEFYILPPTEALESSHTSVAYRMVKSHNVYNNPNLYEPINSRMTPIDVSPLRAAPVSHTHLAEGLASRVGTYVRGRFSATSKDVQSSYYKLSQAFGDHSHLSNLENIGRPQPHALKQDPLLEKNYVRADPSYLKTLGQAHSGWIFGAIAELVDNSRDAKASKLDISIDMIYSKKAGKNIPLLSVIDDGQGMTHPEIVRMTCFGHKQPEGDELERIGRFGVGFKTGAMRLGRDALVLTQTANSRSIAFLSQSLNEGKDNLEIPIVSYRREGQLMEVDTIVQSEALAKYNLNAIKEFSPFNKYLIGEKAGLFQGGTGTQVYIWNLDEWGTECSLEWDTGLKGGSSFHQGDIIIRSKRIRSRPGQISQKVLLDYSLRSYLEVIFLVPRMKIYVQGSLVKSRPLEKSLNKTVIETGNIMGRHVQLTLGRSQLEWEQANCGIFLYWHGRLIEAYKRVGGMIHGADVGRGVIGVIDVTDVMNDAKGRVWVHSNKQGFQDCEPYARLEEWLGAKADEYWDNNFDNLQLKKSNSLYKPDQEWVQCDKCRKWRMLSSDSSSKNLPLEWFCYMEPFKGFCEIPEQKVQRGVITVSTKRSGYGYLEKPVQSSEVDDDAVSASGTNDGDGDDDSDQDIGNLNPPPLKRLRKGHPRACKKT